jgi:D-alanine transaminase
MTRHSDNLILSGITREAIFKCAENLGYEVVAKNVSLQDAQTANEAFITSATAFVTPVVKINSFQIGDGKPGKFVKALREEYIKQALETAI